MSQKSMSSFGLLSLFLGVYFLLLGITGLLDQNSITGQASQLLGSLMGSNNSTITLIVSILQIFCGVVLILGVLGALKGSLMNLAFLVVLILWAAYVVWTSFLQHNFQNGISLSWAIQLAHGMVIFFAIWNSKKTTTTA